MGSTPNPYQVVTGQAPLPKFESIVTGENTPWGPGDKKGIVEFPWLEGPAERSNPNDPKSQAAQEAAEKEKIRTETAAAKRAHDLAMQSQRQQESDDFTGMFKEKTDSAGLMDSLRQLSSESRRKRGREMQF